MARSLVAFAFIAVACRTPTAPPRPRTVASSPIASSPISSASAPVESIPRCVEPAEVRAATSPFGTAHPGIPYRASKKGGWAVVCQARRETNGDGKLRVFSGHHGELVGDEVVAYLSLGGGEGIGIDDFVAADASGRFVVVTQFKKLLLFDVPLGTRTPLDGDIAEGDPVVGVHRAAAFSPDGRWMLYHRRGVVILRELATCRERALELGAGLVARAGFDAESSAVLVAIIERDTNGDGFLTGPMASTTLSERWCRGDAAVASFYGASGDHPNYKRVPLDGGPIVAVDAAKFWVAHDDARELVPASGVKPKGSDAPLGPFRFPK